MKKKKLKISTKLLLGIVLSVFCIANTFTFGFASWIYIQNITTNTGNTDVSMGGITNVNALTVDTDKPVEKFEIMNEGIDNDGEITTTKECGVTFHFKIQNSLIPEKYNTITYSSKLTLGNIANNIDANFVGMAINGTKLAKASSLSSVTNNKQTYSQNFDVAIDKAAADGFTRLAVTYNFRGSMYQALLNDLTLNVALKEVGLK